MSLNTNNITNAAAASLSNNNIFLQSDCLYIQAAGSKGEESTAGIHLRWMLKGPAAEHLPKGEAYQGSPKGFNRQEDFVRLSRIRYQPSITSLYLTSSPTTVVDSEALWLYSSGKRDGRMFYVYFRNTSKYNEVRANTDPFSDPSGFLDKYGSNIIEVENKDSLFFALQLTPKSTLGNAKTEVLSVETNKQNLPKNVTFRRTISNFTTKIFAENARSVRFVPEGTIISKIDFEFYEDAYNREGWEEFGKFALTTDDGEAHQRLDPDPGNYPVHATWPRYNDGEFVNVKNYISKWYDADKDPDNSIKDSVIKYLKFSDDAANPLALDYYYPEDDTSDPNPLEISHFSILQMAALDFHVARMLGLGHMDIKDDVFSGEQYMYAAHYVTEADLGNGHGPFEAVHVSLTLPTSVQDHRLCLPVRLKQPVPGIVSADPTAGITMSSLTDANGYTYDGTARFLSLLTEELSPDEPANSPFYYSDYQFDMSTFTYPVHVGIEYKSSDETIWRLPELPHNPNYVNVFSNGEKAHFETVAIGLPDYGNPAYVHKEKRSGKHKYGSYGVNWFSRAQSASIVFEVESTIKPSNILLPASSVNAFLIQEELPLLLTSQNEQDLYAQNPANDKTLIRLTMEYDASQDMITYQKEVNGVQITDFNPLPDAEELFADHIEVFFRPEIQNRVFGAIDNIADLAGNPLVSVVKTKGLDLTSTGTQAAGTLQILKPTIATSEFPNYIGGVFTVGTDDYFIHNILPGTNPDFPIFHVLKKQVGNAFGQNTSIPFDPANFTVPHANDSFMVGENMQNPTTWGTVNPHPLKIQIGNNWPIHTEEKIIRSGQAPDITENTYFRKFRGIKKTAVVKRFVEFGPNPDPNDPTPVPLPFVGMYEIDFPGFNLGNHPQYSTVVGADSVQWYRGSIRVEKHDAPFEEKSTLKVVRIDNIGNGDLKIFALDEAFSTNPIQPNTMPSRTVEVNFYPGYRAYLHYNAPCRLRNEDILPQNDDLEKYTIFGTRSVDLTYADYKSRISSPTMMFGRKIEAPKVPDAPSGSKYATRPDTFGRSSYAFTTTYKHKPFSVMFLRSNDDILLSSLYKHTEGYNAVPELNSVEYIREHNNDEFFNDRLSGLANAITTSDKRQFIEYNGYRLPIPNSEGLLKGINEFIVDHNKHYSPSIPAIAYGGTNGIQDLSTEIIPADPNGKFGRVTFYDFVKQTIENTYVPLTEVPILYQFIKEGVYQPIPKAQIIRNRNGVLLTPGNDINGEFDMAPMMKILERTPYHKTLFVDYTLDGASTSVYFYAVKETNAQLLQSELSAAVGPIKMVNSFPLKTPEIKSVIPVLEDSAVNVSPKMQVTINPYNKIYNVKKAKLYRALNMQDAISVRTMELVKELDLEQEGVLGDETWTLQDSFSDLPEVPFNDPLYYRVTVEAEVEYAEAQYGTNQSDVIVTEYAPSEASKIMITTITENVLPSSPELKFESNPITGNVVTSGLLSWKEQCYKGKYHLYKMNNQGNWKEMARMNILPNNISKVQLYLFENDPLTNTEAWIPKEVFDTNDKTIFLRLEKLGLDPLTVKDAEGNPIYHHFKVITENTAGMFSKEDRIITMYNQNSSAEIGGISSDGTDGMIIEQTFVVRPD